MDFDRAIAERGEKSLQLEIQVTGIAEVIIQVERDTAEQWRIDEGTVVKVMDFGAFVNFFGAKDGLVHISQLAPRRVQKVTDVVKEGDKVKVKLLGFDERGKVRLSMKVVDQATGEDLEAKQKAEAEQQRTDQQREAAGAE